MIKWAYVNTPKITRIGYNAEIKVMYVEFCGSTVDTPFKNITEDTFREFSRAKMVDDYYEDYIKLNFEQVDTETKNKILCDLK